MTEREEQRLRKRRQERIRRQRRRKRINRLILVALSLLVLVVTVPYIFKNVRAGTVFMPQPYNARVGTSAEANLDDGDADTSPVTEDVYGADEGGASGEEELQQFASESWLAGRPEILKDWEFVTDAAMPDGDIVNMHDEKYSYENVRRDLSLLAQRYPEFLRVYNFGTSLDGRELLDAVVGSDEAERDVIIHYSIHAREHIVTNLGMKQLEELLKSMNVTQYEGVDYTEIFSKVRLHIIPMLNPDGVMISQEGFGAINSEELKAGLLNVFESDKALGKASPSLAEYATTWKANARSVDLNRNFATDGWTAEMGTQQPSCSRYPGTEPMSEPEVRALVDLEKSINCVGQIAYHCHGRIVYWDYGMEEKDPELYAKDQASAQLISGLTATADLEGYAVTSTVDDGQNPGGCSDYFMQVEHIPSLTLEVGNKFKADGSFNDAPLSIDQIDGIFVENAYVLPAVAWFFMG